MKRLPSVISPRALAIALCFGIGAGGALLAGLHLRVPGTPEATDAREIFVALGSAFTGPVGGLIISLFAGAFEPQSALRTVSILHHAVLSLWIAYGYWFVLKRARSTAVFLLCWLALLVVYYFLSPLPLLLLIHWLAPNLQQLVLPGWGSLAEQMRLLYRGLAVEFVLTATITSGALLALPGNLRMPLWRPVRDYVLYLRFRRSLRGDRRRRGMFIVRLGGWLLLLFLFPLLVNDLFVRNSVTGAWRENALREDRVLVQRLASELNAEGAQQVGRVAMVASRQAVYVVSDASIVLANQETAPAGVIADAGLRSVTIGRVLAEPGGQLVDERLRIAATAAWGQEHRTAVVVIRALDEIPEEMQALPREAFFRLGGSLVLTATIGGFILWLLVGIPLQRLARATRRVQRGNLNTSVRSVDLDDEIGRLADRFNAMTAGLRYARRGLEAEILDRRKTEKRLRRSEQRFRELSDLVPLTIFESDLSGRVTFANEHGLREFQLSPMDLEEGMDLLSLVAPEDRPRAREAFEGSLKGMAGTGREYAAIRRDGTRFPALVYSAPILADGAVVGMRGSLVDITLRKRAEQGLSESEARYRTIIEQSSEGIILIDTDGTVIEVNQAFERIAGIPRRSIIGCRAWDVMFGLLCVEERTPQRLEEIREVTRAVLAGQRELPAGQMEVQVERHDGSRGILQQSMFPVKIKDGVRIGCIVREISEQRMKDEALRRSEEKFAKAFHASPDSLTITRISDGAYLEVNHGFSTLTGYRAEEVLGRTSFDIQIWADLEERQRVLDALRGSGEIRELEGRFRLKDGSIKVGLIAACLITIEQEPCLLMITRDITERKRAEEALRESEERFRGVFEHAGVGISYASPDGRFERVNDSWCRITRSSRDVLARADFRTLAVATESAEQRGDFDRLVRGEIDGYTLEKPLVRDDGTTIWVTLTVTLVRDAGHQPRNFVGIMEDITERKKAEQEVAASLEEKELLLKEVHHRVKNNLQIISSLLSLQSGQIREDYDRALFQESQARIRSMALIHERLYQSSDLSRVDFRSYMDRLISFLFQTYRLPHITYSSEVEDIHLSIDTAIPCGLIVNELITNAMKHAFPGDVPGEIYVGLRRIPGGKLELMVRDNGVGMPEGIDLHGETSLGFHLVSILAEQLEGTLELSGSPGTTIRLMFPEG